MNARTKNYFSYFAVLEFKLHVHVLICSMLAICGPQSACMGDITITKHHSAYILIEMQGTYTQLPLLVSHQRLA